MKESDHGPGSTQPANKASILVVDDDEGKLLAVEAVLSGLDLSIVCVRSGREALRKLLGQSFALILLDVNMPGMDGFETAKLIRQRQTSETTPIIFITAYGDELFRERGYLLGAVDYILTPIVPDVLRSKVSVFVELYQQTDHIRRQSQRLEQRATQLSALANQLTEAEHRERRRLAHVLHDDLQQLMVAAKMRLASAMPSVGDAGVREKLQAANDLLDESIGTSRSLAVELSPPILHDGGLRKAMQWLAKKFKKDHDLTVHINAEHDEPRLPEHLSSFLYQTVRELLFNTVKHAEADEAWVRIECSGHTIRVTVQDKGTGFRKQPAKRPSGMGHFGLFSIRERLAFLNGSLDIDTAVGEGTRITVSVPVTPAQPDTPAPPATRAPTTPKPQHSEAGDGAIRVR